MEAGASLLLGEYQVVVLLIGKELSMLINFTPVCVISPVFLIFCFIYMNINYRLSGHPYPSQLNKEVEKQYI